MKHLQPCFVTVTRAITGYYCEYHRNEVIRDETHYEHIVHRYGGTGEVVFESYPCPY